MRRVDLIEACDDPQPHAPKRHRVAGLDPSFSSDPAGLAIVEQDDHGRLVLMKACRFLLRRSQSFEEKRLIEDETMSEIVRELKRHEVDECFTRLPAGSVEDPPTPSYWPSNHPFANRSPREKQKTPH